MTYQDPAYRTVYKRPNKFISKLFVQDPGLVKEPSADDIVIELVLEYIDADENTQLQLLTDIKEELAKGIRKFLFHTTSLFIVYLYFICK